MLPVLSNPPFFVKRDWIEKTKISICFIKLHMVYLLGKHLPFELQNKRK